MIVTTWDGHLRVDRAPGGVSVTLTLLTVEPTTDAELRAGLAAGFVTDDPHGPPALLTVDTVRGRLPDDVADLLSPRVVAAATGPDPTWLRLDLAELDDLAAAWAPYRARVLAPAGAPAPVAAGRAGAGWWTAVELPDWRDLLAGPTPAFRGVGGDEASDDGGVDEGVDGRWLLPAEVADAADVRSSVAWRVAESDGRTVLTVVAERAADAARSATLLVAPDGPTGDWTPLSPTEAGLLIATITIPSGGPVGLRFRTGAPGSGGADR